MIRRFRRDDRGGITIMMLVWSIGFIALAGVAVDITNAFRNKTMLQVTADAAAHAAVTALIAEKPVETAKQDAVRVAAYNLSLDDAPDPVRPSDVRFGTWDYAAHAFTPGEPESLSAGVAPAARVIARRDDTASNALVTTFLRVIGVRSFDVSASSIAVLALPPCGNNGIIARWRVKVTSNLDFGEKMCVHGELGLITSNNLTMGEGSAFSTPDIRHVSDGGNIDVPTGNYPYMLEHSEPGSMLPRAAQVDAVRARIDALRTQIRALPGYKAVTHGKIASEQWDIEKDYLNGYRYFELQCENPKNTYQFPGFSDITGLEGVFIVSTCALKSAGPVYLKDVVIAVDLPDDTESIFLTGKTEIATSAVDCEEAGNFVAMTTGGMKFTADQSYAHTQLIAARNLSYTANATTNFNISIQSWENVGMTAGGGFTNCPSENPYMQALKPFPLLVSG